jgi:hypothetical protein
MLKKKHCVVIAAPIIWCLVCDDKYKFLSNRQRSAGVLFAKLDLHVKISLDSLDYARVLVSERKQASNSRINV